MKQIFYDIENYSNHFFLCMRVVNGDKRTRCVFNFGDHEKLAKIFQVEDAEFVTYNGQGYDNVVIAYWLSLGKDANFERMHAMNDTLISKDPFDHDVQCLEWLKDNYSTLEYEKFGETRVMRFIRNGSEAATLLNHPKRKEVDLYLLGEKTGGLKAAAIVLGIDSLVETPIPFDKPVPEELKPLVVQYCWNDVDVTEKAYAYYKETLVVRKQFEDEGIPNAACLGSAKLAEIYLLNLHEKSTGKRLKRDDRPEYASKDLLTELTAPYEYQFATPEYKQWWKMMSRSTIHYQPHFLQDVFVDDGGGDDDDGVVVKKDLAKPSIYSVGRAFIPRGAMIIPGNGLRLKFGGGGLHNDAEPGIWKKSEAHMLLDIDVTSYYPSLMIANKFSPRHIPELSTYMEGLLRERVAAKKAKRTTEADSKKLVLNSSFGKTKDLHSVLCDPRCHYAVTVNGQLLLMTLIDMMYESIKDVKIINVNTDGICVYFPVYEHEKVKRVMAAWEEFSACSLEALEYEVFAQSTCNLYCGRYVGGKVKTKGGDFKLKPAALKETFAKATGVKKAVVDYLLDGVDPAETISKASASELIMSFTYGKKTFAVIDDVKSDRKALRYLYGKTGVRLGRTRQCDIDEGKAASKVDNGRPVIIGDVLSLIDRDNVDETRYVAQAQEIIMSMLRKEVKGTGADLRRNPTKYWSKKNWRNQ